jgi:hypothetical protein
MPGNESNHSQSEEQPIKVLEQIELIAKASAGIVALTYVSGYLIETTYFGSFGIHTEAIDFFRAKYLYIGFHYWFSIAMFSVFLILIKRIIEFIRAWRHHKNIEGKPELTQHDFDVMPELTPEEREEVKKILERRLPPAEPFLRPSFGELRWTFVVCAIIMVFSFQILFFNPSTSTPTLPLQFIFLSIIMLHQVTHFREYYSYWGILRGRVHVGLLRILLASAELAMAIWILYCLSGLPNLNKYTMFPILHIVVGFVILLIAYLSVFSLLFNHKQMDLFDWPPHEDPFLRGNGLTRKKYMRLLIGGGKMEGQWTKKKKFLQFILSGLSVLVLGDAFSIAVGFDKSPWRYLIIGAISLLLALFVPFNIVYLSAVRKDMYRKLDIPLLDKSSTNQYSILALKVVPITVLYLVSVLAFSHTIYPKIPEEKAGGSYVTTPRAILHYITHTTADNCLLNSTEDKELFDGEHLVLTEDTNWLYIADLKEKTDKEDRNMPEDWRKSLLEIPVPKRPITHAISRNCIEYITYLIPNPNSK